MNIKEEFPKLFKALEEKLRAERAEEELGKVIEFGTCKLKDHDSLKHAFDWGATPQGHNFWAGVYGWR